MQSQIVIPSIDIEKFKQRARKLKQESKITHTEALDLVAKEAGLHHWHHVIESSKIFEQTETAYRSGIIIAMDVKEAEEFKDPSGGFVKDPFVDYLCRDDLYWDYVKTIDEDGIPLREKYSEEKLKVYAGDDLSNYVFFRYTKDILPGSIEEVKALARKCSFWQPTFIWFKGSFHDCHENDGYDEDGNVTWIRY